MNKKALLIICFLFLIVIRKDIYPQAGLLDTTFGQAGVVTNSVNLFKLNSYVRALDLQNDDKIVVAGSARNLNHNNF